MVLAALWMVCGAQKLQLMPFDCNWFCQRFCHHLRLPAIPTPYASICDIDYASELFILWIVQLNYLCGSISS